MTEATSQEKWVMVVEDDEYISKAYSAKFEYEHIAAKFSTDGDEAITMLKNTPSSPALILLDLMLPKKNGFDVLQEIKADAKLKKIPVVILTNLAQENDAKRGLELGAEKYLIKSDTKIADILEVVRAHL